MAHTAAPVWAGKGHLRDARAGGHGDGGSPLRSDCPSALGEPIGVLTQQGAELVAPRILQWWLSISPRELGCSGHCGGMQCPMDESGLLYGEAAIKGAKRNVWRGAPILQCFPTNDTPKRTEGHRHPNPVGSGFRGGHRDAGNRCAGILPPPPPQICPPRFHPGTLTPWRPSEGTQFSPEHLCRLSTDTQS